MIKNKIVAFIDYFNNRNNNNGVQCNNCKCR